MEDQKKKTVTTVATAIKKEKRKKKCLTKALLPLQYLYSANTLSAQY